MYKNHTPGPWECRKATEDHVWVVYSTNKWLQIARVTLNSEDNAKFIAAAPETAAERDRLKEIIKECVEVIENLKDGMIGYIPDLPYINNLIVRVKDEKAS